MMVLYTNIGQSQQEIQEPNAKRARRHHRSQQVPQPVSGRGRSHRVRPANCALTKHSASHCSICGALAKLK